MPRYVVERTFRDSWDIGADGEERCRQIIAGNGDDVTWLHSYVSEDGRKSFCMYEAPSPEAIRKSRPATTCRSTRSRPSVSSIRTPTGQHHHVENDADEIVGAAGGLQWGSALDGSRVYTANANSLSIPWSLVGGGGTTTNGVWSGLDAATGGIIWQQTRSHGGSTSGPVTTANGVVYGCSLDALGQHVRADRGNRCGAVELPQRRLVSLGRGDLRRDALLGLRLQQLRLRDPEPRALRVRATGMNTMNPAESPRMKEAGVSRTAQALASLVPALILALALEASVGSGAPSPCPGNYDPVTYPAEDQSPDYVQADTNGNFIVCVYQGSNPNAEPIRDDRLAEEVATEDCRTVAERSTDAPLCVSHSGGAHRSARIAGAAERWFSDSDRGQLPHLSEPDVVARGVAERRVDPVGPLLGLLDELDTAPFQLLVRRMHVVGGEEDCSGEALRH
jgi:Protein of unknown function (DUF4242)